MRGMKFTERFKSTQVHALNSSETSSRRNKACDGSNSAKKIRSFLSMSKSNNNSTTSGIANLVAPFQLPSIDTLEPCIEPYLKPINLVETLAELYHRQECCHQSQKALLYMEQYSLLCNLRDQKLLRRCLRSARQNSVDVLSKVVLSAWLRFERREDELEGVSSMECGGGCILECPKVNLIHGFNPCSIKDRCQCGQETKQETSIESVFLPDEEKKDVCFCIGNEEINCVRWRIAALSDPFKAMLYGGFAESKMRKINFTKSGVCPKGMMAVELYSRAKRLDFFTPMTVLELLSFANRFCCEEMKSTCDAYLASIVGSVDDALILFDYGLEERAPILVASCLQVFLRELPKTLYNSKVMKILCSSEAKERLAMVGYDSFLLYYFLSQVAMEESMVSKTTMMLLERLGDCAKERWQKALAYHQLGCVMLERKEYKDSQHCFEVAAEAGHVYSVAGVARTKHKQGQSCSAYKLISSLIFEHKPTGWMYQERALCNTGRETSFDLDVANELDPSLSYPYKYRALAKVEEKQIMDGIVELDKIIGFKLSPDCLELRAWLFIALQNYDSAMRDIRALLTLEPNYITSHAKITGKYLVHLLSHELFSAFSSVTIYNVKRITHINEFRRLNCQKAAMHSLRMARNHSSSIQERLIYEGWILYDTGYREETLARADRSITIQKSFEAFFLKAYVLADTNLDAESSSYVIQLLEAALKCPSDGLRKGQALNNLGSIYVDCGKLDLAKACYENALAIRHTRAHQGLARVYHQKNQRKAAYDEMTKLIEKAASNASAYEKRSEYCDREMAKGDLDIATQMDPLRTYPYRYRAAVMMDEQKETEAVEELTKAISFKPDLQMLHLRAAFYESMGDLNSALQDCQAALCLDPNHTDTLDLYQRAQKLRF
ncbi:hypothetical protein TanjilG_32573 [Lupinus angustifolius]|uniref:BTB domain-containing protein n=1 Tax=Lupinus angustifolius TaxID=3871 RepID=A0A4P1R811_LUPAN|nr:hypothetical protein TanjilG_32573 [Lupinus angustifolius]